MSDFVCRLGTTDGRVIEEVHEASDPSSLRYELERQGFHVFSMERSGLRGRFSLPRLLRREKRVPMGYFLVFNQELAALLKAGLPLLQALDMMLERVRDEHFRTVLTDIRDRVKSGENLSDAVSHFGAVFPPLYASTLKAGERSGDLERVLRRFIRYLKLVLEARKKVVSALIYPAVLVGLSVTMIGVLTIYVMPRFAVFYEDLDAELPLLTRITLGISSFFRDNWLWLVGLAALAYFFGRQWSRTETGRIVVDRAKLRVPFIGPVLHRFSISELCRALATLLEGGFPLVPSLEIAISSVSNLFVRHRLQPSVQMVREGKALYASLEEADIFDDLGIDMVRTGESTGALDTMLESLSDFLDEEVETRMQRILSLIEPLMLVFMGIVVSLLLISVYLPMFSVMGQIK